MKLQNELDKIPEDFNQIKALPPLEQLRLYWGAIAAILTFVKIFTGKKADEKIDLILEWGKTNL